MSKPAILKTMVFPFPGVEEKLKESFEVLDWPKDASAQDALLKADGGRILGVATNSKGPVTADMIARMPALKIVSSSSAGYEGIDVDELKRRGIDFASTSAELASDVADMGFTLVLAVMRRLVEADKFVRSGRWQAGRMAFSNRVRDSRIGIVGLGQIGSQVAGRATAFGMEVGYYGRSRKPDVPYRYFDSPVEIAKWCNVLLLSCVGGDETRHLVNAEVLDAIGPNGWLVNIARGSVVDQAALIAALKDGRIKGAGLDVLEGEPAVPAELAASDRVVLTPHYSSSTEESKVLQGQALFGNLARRLL